MPMYRCNTCGSYYAVGRIVFESVTIVKQCNICILVQKEKAEIRKFEKEKMHLAVLNKAQKAKGAEIEKQKAIEMQKQENEKQMHKDKSVFTEKQLQTLREVVEILVKVDLTKTEKMNEVELAEMKQMKEAESERTEKMKEVELEKLRKIERSEKERKEVELEKARMKKETDSELAKKEMQLVQIERDAKVKIARIGEKQKTVAENRRAEIKRDVFLESIKGKMSTTKMLLDAAKDEKDKEAKMEILRMLAGLTNEAITDGRKSDDEMHMHASVYKLTTLIGARSGSPQLQKGVALYEHKY